jgi:hypothetical protein
VRAVYGFSREAQQYAFQNPLRRDRGGVTGRVALEGKPVHIPDVLADPEYNAFEYQRLLGQRTNLGVPLLREGATIGVFSLTRTKVNPIEQVFWTGAKYAVTAKLDVMGGYYHYLQNSFGVVYCTTAALSTCRGTQDAVSLAVDWKFGAKFDAYAGFMYSQVNNGLASGFLHRSVIDPTIGIRFQF